MHFRKLPIESCDDSRDFKPRIRTESMFNAYLRESDSLKYFQNFSMDANSPEKWFKTMPVLTRGLLVGMFSTTCLVVLGLLDPHSIVLDWHLVTQRYTIADLDVTFT